MKPLSSPTINQYYSPASMMISRPTFKKSLIKPSTSNTQRQRQMHLSTAPSNVRSVKTEEEEFLNPNHQFLIEEAMKSKDLQSLVDQLQRTLASVSRNEIELNRKASDLSQKTLENQVLTQQVERLKQFNNFGKAELLEAQKRYILCQNEVQRLLKESLNEKKLHEEYARKITQLEKRIEMMLEKNLNTHQDTLKRTLNDLIKDNEQLKRVLIGKNKEIERLKEINQKLANKNLRLNKKLDSLKTRRVSKENRDEQEDEEQNQDLATEYAFDPSKIPSTLEFRIQHISTEYSNILLDIIEHGPELFASQVNSLEDVNQRKDLVTLVAQQFISFKDFAERTNTLFSELISILSYDNLEDFQVHISKAFRGILNAEIVHIWVADEMTGSLLTYDMSRKKKRALLVDGAFSEVIYQNKILTVNENILLYRTDQGDVMSSKVLLLPFNRPTGLLEISQASSEYAYDLQYFALILAKASKQVMQRIINNEAVTRELKYRDLFYDSFLLMMNTKTKQELCEQIYGAANRIFHMTQCVVLFVEDSNFIKFDNQGRKEKFGLNIGFAGFVYNLGRAQIVTDIRKNENFDENIDVQSILPIFCSPLKKEGIIVGMIEFVLKKKKEFEKMHKFGISGDVVVKQDTIDYDAQKFCEFVQTALILKDRQ